MTKKEKERYDGPGIVARYFTADSGRPEISIGLWALCQFWPFSGKRHYHHQRQETQNNLLTLWTLNNDYVSALRR